MINSLLGKKGKSTYINGLNIDNTSVTDPKLIAESLNDYFVSIGLELAMDCSSQGETNNKSEDDLSKNCNNTRFCFSHINIESVLTNLKI